MDDLISRKALLAAYDERHKGPPGGARELIEDAPGVEAVPLDKLCEWLSEYTVPCKLGIRCEYAVDFTCLSDKDCWRYVLIKWMEGLDAEVH